ncbi:bifunctional glutamate N-acetyltransferase/amino-acid acetyltransferase ArgJ [Halothermothrix orenii]|uniref:Arginine biosynthesis bifunctional protein ArgJ n=1 Tax=Halothermothrix orenii (strain H 168 / OCM 544 / DSM 9562) TaxID=373903 RepID=B8D1G7_HALOH|nr:bifunctional glutamate N-acetyltransferase/amino-acid acetyltransferase ArgJ [Halothermothrix orenii]ACL69044.1 N-acetylglutamate synthase;glutamate N-acetyltransferase [Halothermothrix orenii H 168]
MSELELITGGITAPRGFLASGVSCGIKQEPRRDLALIYSKKAASVAGVFTTNRVQAAPVILSRERVKGGTCRAIIVNSGNANACTGKRGLEDARAMTARVAEGLRLNKSDVLIASTGVIGTYLPMDCIQRGIDKAISNLSDRGGSRAAEAILTTDTCTKEIAIKGKLPSGSDYTIGGMAKGSGMIHPNMATMLAFITTDLAILPPLLNKALKQAVEKSFNRISVDGDQSTNDSVFLIANGLSGNKPIVNCGKDYESFLKDLKEVCNYLARKIVLDGEGATKFVTVKVEGAYSEQDAVKVGREVANSNLVKTALFGSDPNWGRIVAAVGYSGIDIAPDLIEVTINGRTLYSRGQPWISDDINLLSGREVVIEINLNQGEGSATFWTTDLSHDYIKINADYHT